MTFVVLRLSSLGDVILASGIPGALKKARPESGVVFMTKTPYREAAEMMPGVDKVIVLDASPWAMAKTLRGQSVSAVLDLQGGVRTTLVRALCPGLSFTTLKNGSLSRRRAVRDHSRLALLPTRLQAYGETLGRALGEKDLPSCLPTLTPPPEALEAADEILSRLKGPQPVLAVAPGSLWGTKQWPVESFAELARRLADRARILVLGSESESSLTAQVASAGGSVALDLGGRTDLKLAAALLARSRGAVTNDSGLMHLSQAVGTPVIALFGSTVPELGFRPWLAGSQSLGVDLPCRPCHVHGKKTCPLGHFKCMKDLTVEMVAEASFGLLRRRDGETQ